MSTEPMTTGSRVLTGNSPLALGPRSTAWRVAAGRAQVFALVRADAPDDPAGNGAVAERIPLFALDPGDWAFPVPGATARPGPDSFSTGLLLVALEEDTELEPMGRPPAGGNDADRTAGPEIGTAEFRHAAETWAERLAETIADPVPPAGKPLPVAGPAEVAAGEAVWPALRTAWIAGPGALSALHLFGGPAFELLPGEPAAVPLPASAWVRVGADAWLDVVPSEAPLEARAAWRGLQAFTSAALARLEDLTRQRRESRAEVISHREAREARIRERTYSRLAEIVDGRAVSGLDTSDRLPAVLALVAQAVGITLRAPERLPAADADRLDVVARASGVRWRQVTLRGRWWREDIGPLLGGMADDGAAVALLPRGPGRMEAVDPDAGTRRLVDAELAAKISPQAVLLYRPLPPTKVSGRDVLRFAGRAARADLVRLGLLAVAVGAISIVTPLVTKAIFASVVPQRELSMLAWLIGLLVAFAVGSFALTMVQQLAIARISAAVTSTLQTAIWDRVLDLPLPFFRRYTAGALANRVMAIDQIQQLATTIVAASVLAVPVGLFNLGLAFWLSARLALFGLIVLALVLAGIAVLTRAQVRHITATTRAMQESFGMAMQLVDGVGKLRVAGAENRAFAQWAARFAALKTAFISAQRGFAAVTTFTAAGTALGALAMFAGAATLPKGALSAATFIAFNTAFTQALSATTGLTGVATFFAQSRPLYDSARPVLETEREMDTVKADPSTLSGAVEVSHVTFRYAPDAPAVLDDVSFTVEAGEFVAIVGPSGAGKSSLLRILLGFEQPEVGSVRYDGKDLDSLDLRSVRQQIGVVTQSVRLLPGEIFTNIVGTRPLSMDDAWAAAEVAGIAEDIRAMPMQMHTFVAEGASTFSGGQRQRLLIARAVVAKPRLLLFDEATSALDNRTQGQVSDAIAGLRAARVVIAHRLSTIRHADKIIVLQDGKVAQSGTYDALMSAGGPFATLARRQLT
jgi:NHLM bacteriocin system ABC transporter ATP-binding protein